MNLVISSVSDASIRVLFPAALAALFIAVARWRGKLLTASFEHALWTCVLAAMLAFALPKVTVRAGTPVSPPRFQPTAPEVMTVTPTDSHPVASQPISQRIPWLALIWLCGATCMSLRIALGLALTRRSLRGARSILGESPIRSALSEHAAVVEAVDESGNATVPCTVGWPGSRIVLPLTWRTWPAEKVRAVIGHELAHVRRRDLLVQYFCALNKVVFWFHPLAWWLERRLAELAEFAADEAALATQSDPHSYAEVLVEIASIARPSRLRWASASVDFATSGFARINRRVNRILDSRYRSGPMKVLWAAALVMAALTFVRFERPLRAQVNGEPANIWPLRAERLRDMLEYLANTDGPFATWISPEQAADDERQLLADPEDERARLELSVHYFNTKQTGSRMQLVDWMIEHHPESPLHSLLSMTVSPSRDGGEAYTSAVDWWRVQLAAHPTDANVLLNAAKAIGESSRSEEIALLKKGQTLDQDRFTNLLARHYSTTLASTADLANSDLSNSYDAMLLGRTGSLMVEHAAQALSRHRPNYDLESIRSVALELLKRAWWLEPSNQKWPDAMEGAKRLSATEDTSAAPIPQGPPLRIRIGAQVAKANLITAPEPLKNGTPGTVNFQVSIGTDGRVMQLTLLSGPPALVQPAMQAVSKYVYKPTLLNGVPVEVQTTVELVF